MKKSILVLIIILFALIALVCAGMFLIAGFLTNMNGDWGYPLPNAYEISRNNAHEICLVKMTGSNFGTVVLNDYILAFQYDERYAGIKALTEPEWEQNAAMPSYEQTDIVWYIADTKSGTIIGPLTSESEYGKRTVEIGCGSLCPWIATYPTPNGALFP